MVPCEAAELPAHARCARFEDGASRSIRSLSTYDPWLDVLGHPRRSPSVGRPMRNETQGAMVWEVDGGRLPNGEAAASGHYPRSHNPPCEKAGQET